MALNINISIGFFIFSALLGLFFPSVNAQAFAPAPAPTSDGTTIDQEHGPLLKVRSKFVRSSIYEFTVFTVLILDVLGHEDDLIISRSSNFDLQLDVVYFKLSDFTSRILSRYFSINNYTLYIRGSSLIPVKGEFRERKRRRPQYAAAFHMLVQNLFYFQVALVPRMSGDTVHHANCTVAVEKQFIVTKGHTQMLTTTRANH
ncbi:hypothetical protein Leryth_016159 [Lithospermum erythrorhizon]|nr:hypothetical protein Leryth_016159 [Lithospermum erythrorhizon]